MPAFFVKQPMKCPYCASDVVELDGARVGNFKLEERVAYLISDDGGEDTRELLLHQTVLVCCSCDEVVDILQQAT